MYQINLINITGEEAVSKGYFCKTKECTGPGQWYLCNLETNGFTIDCFTGEIVLEFPQIWEGDLFSEEEEIKKISSGQVKGFSEEGQLLGWEIDDGLEGYQRAFVPVMTVEDYENPIEFIKEDTGKTVEEALGLGWELQNPDFEYEFPECGVYYFIREGEKFVTKYIVGHRKEINK